MLDRNELTFAVIWPNGPKASIELFDTSPGGGGEAVAKVRLDRPMLGSQIAKMIPDGFVVDVGDCTVVKTSGAIVRRSVGEFDTNVQPKRAERTLEDQMNLIMKRQKRLDARQEELAIENARLRSEREEVVEEPPETQEEPPETQEEPPETQEAPAEGGEA